MATFGFPLLLSLLVGALAFWWGGTEALLLVALLAALETTLSFDNAVVNARVLREMSPLWQRRFLVWGIPIAVFGTRVLLPFLIVSVAGFLSPLEVARIAFFDPLAYGRYLEHAHTAIASFGSAFLLMVALKYFFDEDKQLHWIPLERHFSRWGNITAIELSITTAVILCAAGCSLTIAPTILFAGLTGMLLFSLIETAVGSFGLKTAAASGAALFFYLETLDAAFSLDGVVAAFAITDRIPLIIGGLGIGALFVRSFTVTLVRRRTLESLIYLEHGAHWAIFALALCMLASIFTPIPDAVPGLVGLFVIALAFISSRKARG